MASNDIAILVSGSEAAPLTYEVPPSQEIRPLSINAIFDGTAAAGAFRPTIEILTDAGFVIARVPTLSSVAAGGSAEVTFAPFLRGQEATATAAGAFSGGEAGAISLVGTGTHNSSTATGLSLTTTITLPTGIQANDMLLIFLGAYCNTQPLVVHTFPAGWSLLYLFNLPVFGGAGFSQSTPRACYFKVADGSESGAVVSFTVQAPSSANIAMSLVAAAFRGVDTTDSGSFSFKSYILPASASSWSIAAPTTPVPRPPSQILQILYDVKRNTSVTPPADTSIISDVISPENSVTLYVAGKTADTAPADTWTGTIVTPAASTSYFEMCQLVLNPIVNTGS